MKNLLSKIKGKFFVQILLLVIAVIFLIGSYRRSYDSMMAMIFPVNLEGEYCQDGGEWKTYHTGEKISALKGDLIFRGNFELDLSDVEQYQLYLDHIEATIYKNGEKVYSSKIEYPVTRETTCVKRWDTWFCEPVQPEPEMEQIAMPLPEEIPWRMVGELYQSYIIVEQGEEAFLIDKHAAHERILFEKLKANQEKISAQSLLTPIPVRLSPEGAAELLSNAAMLQELGFEIEENTLAAIRRKAAEHRLGAVDIGRTAACRMIQHGIPPPETADFFAICTNVGRFSGNSWFFG